MTCRPCFHGGGSTCLQAGGDQRKGGDWPAIHNMAVMSVGTTPRGRPDLRQDPKSGNGPVPGQARGAAPTGGCRVVRFRQQPAVQLPWFLSIGPNA